MDSLIELVILGIIAMVVSVASSKARKKQQAGGVSPKAPRGSPASQSTPELGQGLAELLQNLGKELVQAPDAVAAPEPQPASTPAPAPVPVRKTSLFDRKQPLIKSIPAPAPLPAVSLAAPERIHTGTHYGAASRYIQAVTRGGQAGLRQSIAWAEILGTPRGLE